MAVFVIFERHRNYQVGRIEAVALYDVAGQCNELPPLAAGDCAHRVALSYIWIAESRVLSIKHEIHRSDRLKSGQGGGAFGSGVWNLGGRRDGCSHSNAGRSRPQAPNGGLLSQAYYCQTDLGRISFLWLNGESGSRRERFCARGWRPLGRKRIPGGVGILFSHRGHRGRKRSPAASASRADRSKSGPDTFADRGLSTFTGGWVTIVFSVDDTRDS